MEINVDKLWHDMLLEQDGKLVLANMCRLCGSTSLNLISLYGDEGLENDLQSKIDAYLPVQVLESDSLPHKVCSHCASILVSWHDLTLNCVKTDEKLKELLCNERPSGEIEQFDENISCLIEDETNLNAALVCEGSEKLLDNSKKPAVPLIPTEKEVQRFQAAQCEMFTNLHSKTGKDITHSSLLVDGEEFNIEPYGDVPESVLLYHPAVTNDLINRTATVKYYSLILDKPVSNENFPIILPQQIQNIRTSSVMDNLLNDLHHSYNGISSIDETACVFNESSSDSGFQLSLDHNYVLPESNITEDEDGNLNQENLQEVQPKPQDMQLLDPEQQELKLQHTEQLDEKLLQSEQEDLQVLPSEQDLQPQPEQQHLQLPQPDNLHTQLFNLEPQHSQLLQPEEQQPQQLLLLQQDQEVQHLEQLDQLEQFEQLGQLEQLEQLDHLDQLDHLEELDHLEQLDRLEQVERLVQIKPLQEVKPLEQLTQQEVEEKGNGPSAPSKRALYGLKIYEIKIIKTLDDKIVCKVLRRSRGNKSIAECNYCFQNFNNLHVLQTHTRFHAGIMPFYCKYCGQNFHLSASLRQHLESCSRVKYSTDAVLDEEFERNSFKMNSIFSCEICGKKYKLKASLKEHLKHHEGKARMKLKCEFCGARFFRKAELMQHTKFHDATVLSTCNVCEKTFLNSKDLQEHQISHSDVRPFPCLICGMSYKRKSHLTRHLLVHTNKNRICSGRRPHLRRLPGEVFRCDKCGKVCRTRYLLSLHMVCHTGERNHVCYFCGKGFAQSSALTRHLHTVHGGAKDFRCDVCDRCFTAKATKESHMRIHTGEKPYQCIHCGKTFRTNQQHKLHEKIHSDDRPFSCEYCEKSFRRRPHLIVHTRTHTGEKPYGCSLCGRGFAQKNDLNKHMKIHTRNF